MIYLNTEHSTHVNRNDRLGQSTHHGPFLQLLSLDAPLRVPTSALSLHLLLTSHTSPLSLLRERTPILPWPANKGNVGHQGRRTCPCWLYCCDVVPKDNVPPLPTASPSAAPTLWTGSHWLQGWHYTRVPGGDSA